MADVALILSNLTAMERMRHHRYTLLCMIPKRAGALARSENMHRN